jgi:hypothetical protein
MNATRWFAFASVGLAVLSFAAEAISQETNSHWIIPTNPNPSVVLREAEADKRAGKYEDALAKQVWFHENAIKIQPSQYGVRLSFALQDWIELGKVYPPALEKLKSIRDNDDDTIRKNKSSRSRFHDFESINEYLKEINRTKDTFVWLDTNAPDFAEQVFDIAEPDLIRTKEYSLCGKYLHPDISFPKIQASYQETAGFSRDFATKSFFNKSATLVALLVINGRTNEANDIATKAEKVLTDQQFKILLAKAKKGGVPTPWP